MIPVIWWKQSRGNWDHGIFLQTFEKYPDLFPQYNDKEIPDFRHAIVMVSGKPSIPELASYINRLKSATVILCSEEDAFFQWKKIVPKRDNFDVWTQYYNPLTKREIKERILLGAPYRIKDYKINKHLPKKYLWSFVGQVQNPFRQQAVEVLSKMDDGYLKGISGFGGYTPDGMDYQEYLDIMCQSKFVICPAGSMSVDSFRLYEAMECGAIPITDKRAPRDHPDHNYWSDVCPYNGLTYLWEWDEDILRSVFLWNEKPPVSTIPLAYKNHIYTGPSHNYWWFRYKHELEEKLLKLAQ